MKMKRLVAMIKNVSPNTGDNNNIALWLALMIVSLLSLAAAIYLRRERRSE